MKPDEASFFRLFRRSRYYRRIGNDENSDFRMERERFAAAAIGFCLKHSSHFREQFWRQICRVAEDPACLPTLNIEVEPDTWADIRLTSKTTEGRFVWVVECKVGASLENKQNPGHADFIKDEGYGRLLLQFGENNGDTKHLRYIVLGAKEIVQNNSYCVDLNIAVQQRDWSQMAGMDDTEPLIMDLFDSLGALDIPSFRMKKTRLIQVNGDFSPAGQAWEVINALVESKVCGYQKSSWHVNLYSPAEYHFNIGGYLKRPPLQKGSSGLPDNLLWAGYESGPTISVAGNFRRSVWFYRQNHKSANELVENLKPKIAGIPGSTVLLKEEDAAWYALVFTDSDSNVKDLDWFEKVIESAASELV